MREEIGRKEVFLRLEGEDIQGSVLSVIEKMEEEDVNEMKRNSRKRFMRNNEEGKGGRARNETKKNPCEMCF